MNINKLIKELIYELDSTIEIPNAFDSSWLILRSLMNTHYPVTVSKAFLEKQNKVLQFLIKEKGITDVNNLPTTNDKRLIIWQGDITTLKVDAIVNAANNQLLGCFVPGHKCIDNAIHTFSGLQLREECNRIMSQQGHAETTGTAKVTNAYNLPSTYVIHTVGPIIHSQLTTKECRQLVSSYESCLEAANKKGLKSIAFCCISTGEFRFPNDIAAQLAIKTVKNYLNENTTSIEKVVFNVFKEEDLHLYEKLLG